MTGQAAAVLLLAALLSPLGRAQEATSKQPPFGQRIVEILFSPADQPLSRDQLGLSLGLRPGDVLTEKNLSQAIASLYLTGRYTDIAVDGESLNGGVSLTFRTENRYFVSRVTIEGVPDPPNPGRLEASAQLDLGQAFEEDSLNPAVERIREVLLANGFHTPTIRYEVTRREETEEVDIRFVVEPGERARLSRPEFSGNLQLPEKTLIRKSGWLKWYGLRGYKDETESTVRKGIENIRGAYLKKNYLQSEVRLTELSFLPEKNIVTPRLEIDAGPRVNVLTEGQKLGSGTLRDLIPIYQERTVDRELLLEGERNIAEYYRAKGYANPKVSHEQQPTAPNGEQTIVYTIDRGPRSKLVEIRIEGAKYFDLSTIRERLSMVPAGLPRSRNGQFSRSLLDRDKDAIVDLYESSGFREAKVTHEILGGPKGKAGEIVVVLHVEEGPQWLVEKLEFSGVDLRLYETVQSLVTSTPGQPFSATNVANDRDSVLNYYFNSGYPEATLEVQVTTDPDRRIASLVYRVTEGRRYFVRDVLISGAVVTRMDLVRSRLLVNPGEPLSQSRIVETQRRLYDLGVFANVDVAVQNPDGKERNKYVLMQIDEARRYSLTLGFGAELGRFGGGTNFDSPAGTAGFSPRGLIGISRSNIFGLAHTASATARASNIQQRLVLNYIAPQFRGNENFNLSFSTLLDRSRDVNTFTSSRVEGAVQFAQRATRAVTLQYRASIRRVFIDENSLNISPILIPVYSQPVRTTLFSFGLLQDRRDDPIDATRGIYNTFDFGYAPEILGGQTRYTRLLFRNSTYHRIGRDLVLARSGSFGWIENLDDEVLPLPEKFYSGGATTHRGFPENQAGPRDPITGFPIGGEAFLFLNHEIRFPLLGRNLGGVLFHDMGNVYSKLEEISFRVRQKNLADFDYMVHAVGFGIRFKTPVGPVRVDLAYAPNTPRFFGLVGDRDEIINNPNPEFKQQRVSRFQFHFSIGQAF